MSYNKKAHLRANIDAIKLVFALDKEQRPLSNDERQILLQYSGFGGLKCVLNPANSLADVGQWAKSELELFPMVAELHKVIKDNTNTDQEYKDYVSSIKNSVLTAFYTPKEVVEVIADVLKDNAISVDEFLDPSAGMGEFSNAFHTANPRAQHTNFEKDLLTGKMLAYINPDDKVKIEGFENIEARYNGHFDVISSNIPFGEMNVFDSAFRRSEDRVHQQATKSIHNYFFVKGVETLREGGVMAFITSQGVMNSPNNEPIRQWLMQKTNLVSAIRLPNNLFTDIAGTEVGSDLIILQKNTQKQGLTVQEKNFVSTSEYAPGLMKNDSFENYNRVVHTKGFLGTDPYGRKAQIFGHEGGIEGIARDMKGMLQKDFSQNLNIDLYQKYQEKSIVQVTSTQSEVKEKVSYQALEVNVSEPVMSLYDLFGFLQEERTQVKPKRKSSRKPTNQKPAQLSLFSKPQTTEQKPNAYPIDDARKSEQQERLKAEIAKELSFELRPFSGELKDHHKEGSLVEDDGQIGYLKNRYKDDSNFQPLDLHFAERSKISRYVEIRDTYHALYNYEAKNLQVHESLRSNLNLVYDNFVRRHGVLNDKKNLDVIKMDAGGNEILFLERSVNGAFEKADIFHQPVAFNPNEISHAETSDEALAASLNKYGEIRMDYMQSLLDGKSQEDIANDLVGRIYFNPLEQNYEIKDKFISGNGSVLIPSFGDRIYFSVFHSISAFCNAGFSTLPHGIMENGYVDNYGFQLSLIFLFVLGGLGFPIVINLLKYLKYLIRRTFLQIFSQKKDLYKPWVMKLDSKINLITTFSLIAIGTILISINEYNNILASHQGIGKLVTALFTATTPRTAGFNSIDFNQLHLSSLIIVIILMWIGASPASTGGGVKTSTFAIAVLNFISLARGRKNIELYNREVSEISIKRAFAVMTLSVISLGIGSLLISYFDEGLRLLDILFESVSAYSTVGLSLGITPFLSSASKLVLIILMFAGRVTTLTLLIAFFKQMRMSNYTYPSEEILIN